MPSIAKLAVIGDPISHSLSPVLQNFLIRHFALPFSYEALQIRPTALPEMMQRLRDGEFRGINVTLPHKQGVVPFLDEIESTAAIIGAVNTIVAEEGKLTGYNTDVAGFAQNLKAAKIALEEKTVLVLGAGGAAPAVIFALSQVGAREIFLCNRSPEHAETLRNRFRKASAHLRLQTIAWPNRLDWLRRNAVDIIVNTTSVGMHPHIDVSPLPAAAFAATSVAVDLVYNPLQTAFLRAAISAGAKIVNGLGMLIYQGVAALELWSRQPLDIQAIYPQLENELINAMKHAPPAASNEQRE